MISNRQSTKNFWLNKMIVSKTATRFSFTEQLEPSSKIIINFELSYIKTPVYINSDYRCIHLNTSIGGATKSQHLIGQAANIEDSKNGNEFLLRKIAELKISFRSDH